MKVHPFHISLATILFFVLCISIFPGISKAVTDPLEIEKSHQNLPRAAQFFPKNAELTIHWLIQPDESKNSFQEFTKKQENKEALNSIKSLRNGFFALAGLDFENEIEEYWKQQKDKKV